MGEFSLDIWVNIVGRKYWNVRYIPHVLAAETQFLIQFVRIGWKEYSIGLARKGNQNLKIGPRLADLWLNKKLEDFE